MKSTGSITYYLQKGALRLREVLQLEADTGFALGCLRYKIWYICFQTVWKPLQTFFSTSSSPPFFSSSGAFLFVPFPSFFTTWEPDVAVEPRNEVKATDTAIGYRAASRPSSICSSLETWKHFRHGPAQTVPRLQLLVRQSTGQHPGRVKSLRVSAQISQ